MPTPFLYQTDTGGNGLFAETPPERRTVDLELLYITDRAPGSDLPYGDERSRSLIFGSAVVKMVPNLTWADLERQSRLGHRTRAVNLELIKVRERGRFPEEPYDMAVRPEGVIRSPTAVAQHRQVRGRFEAELREQLRQSPSKDVVLCVHGFDETFATVTYTMTDLCHYLGRKHVCMIFSWPAPASGNAPITSTSTAQSATFAADHLRKAIRMIAQTPGVQGVHLLAHSQGSAVLLQALRELAIEAVAAGVEPADALKLNNVVLVAPDLEEEVSAQPLEIFTSDPDMMTLWPYERIPNMLRGRMTVYASTEDRASFISRILFRKRSPSGPPSLEQMTVESQTRMGKRGKLDFVTYEGTPTNPVGQSSFLSNPALSSDLIQLIRYQKGPGDPGRPLKKIGPVAWTFPEPEPSPKRR